MARHRGASKHRKRRWDDPFCFHQKLFNETVCQRDRSRPVCSPDGFLYFGRLMRKSELNSLMDGGKPRDKVVEYATKPQFALLPIREQWTVLALCSYLLGYERDLNDPEWRKKHLSYVMHIVLGTISYKISKANIHEALNFIVELVENITRKKPVARCYNRDEFKNMCKQIDSTLLKKTEETKDAARGKTFGEKYIKNDGNPNGGNVKLTPSKTTAYKKIHQTDIDGNRSKRGAAGAGDRSIRQGGKKAGKNDAIGLLTERVVECLNKSFPKTEKKTVEENTETTDTDGTSEILGNQDRFPDEPRGQEGPFPLNQDKEEIEFVGNRYSKTTEPTRTTHSGQRTACKDDGTNEFETFCYERQAIEERVLCEEVADIVERYKLVVEKMKTKTAFPRSNHFVKNVKR